MLSYALSYFFHILYISFLVSLCSPPLLALWTTRKLAVSTLVERFWVSFIEHLLL